MQELQQLPVPVLIGLVAENAIVQYCRVQPTGGKQCGRGNKAVHQHNHPVLRRLQHGPAHLHDFKAAESRQYVQRRLGGCVLFHCRLQNVQFPRQSGIVQSGTPAHATRQRNARELVHQHRRRRRVANAHLAEADHIAAFLAGLPHNCCPFCECRFAFGQTHGGFAGEVSCALPNALGNQNSIFQITETPFYTRVNNGQRKAVLAAEHIDGRPARQEVQHHLPRHFRRIAAHAFIGNAVVGGKHDYLRCGELWRQRLLDQADLRGDCFQHPQCAGGFGLVVDFMPYSFNYLFGSGLYVKVSHLECVGK